MNINLLGTSLWLHNSNVKTVSAKLLQSVPSTYHHELLPDSTSKTQIAYDFIDAVRSDAPLVVLFHGLEGDSVSHYAVGMMKAMQCRGWHDVVAHSRGCDGIANTAPVFYHSDDTRGIGSVLETLAVCYPRIYAAGVSFGGNTLAKYLDEEGTVAVPRVVATVSTPVNLTAVGTYFDRGMTRLFYACCSLHSLMSEAEILPHFQTASPLKNCETLGGLDGLFTVPLYGFTDRRDCCRRASCKPLLRLVHTPLLLLNVINDPFPSPRALSTAAEASNAVTLLQPPYGGHVGFVSKSGGRLNIEWILKAVLHYLETHGREAVWKAAASTSLHRKCKIGRLKNSQAESQL